MAARLKFVKTVWNDMLVNGGVEKILIENLKIVSAEPTKIVCTLPVEQKHTNRLGMMHGGVISTLVDVGGSLAVAGHGMWLTGVTTDLATTFLASSGKPGDQVEIHCHLQKMGRMMAYTFVELRHPETQKLLARGNHTKYIANAFKSDRNVKFDKEETVE